MFASFTYVKVAILLYKNAFKTYCLCRMAPVSIIDIINFTVIDG